MSRWKKTLSTIATASLLASLLGSAFAATVSANADPELLTAPAAPVQAGGGNYAVFTGKTAAAGQYAFTISGGSFAYAANDFELIVTPRVEGEALYAPGVVALTDGTRVSNDDQIWVTAGEVGTAIITELKFRSGTGWLPTGNTYSVGFVAGGTVAVSPATSVLKIVGPGAACTIDNLTGSGGVNFTETALASADREAAPAATLCVYLANAAGYAITDATATGYITGAGLFGNSLAKVTLDAGGQAGVYTAALMGSALPGTALITVHAARPGDTAVIVGSKPFIFSGPIASITAVAAKPAIAYGAFTDRAVKFIAKDTAGNQVSLGFDATYTASGKAASATVTSASAPGATDPYGYAGVTCAGGVGTGTIALKTVVSGVTVSSNPVILTCSDTAKTFSLAFDRASVAPGGVATLTLSAKDANGLSAWDAPALISTMAVNGGALLGGGTNNYNGTYSWTWIAPSTTGSVTAAVTSETLELTRYATIAVSMTPAAATSAKAALGKVTTGFTAGAKTTTRGKWITFAFGLGAANAGKSAEIWVAKRGANGKFGAYARLTSRTIGANGVALFSWKSSKASWISVRAKVGTTATRGIQARWK